MPFIGQYKVSDVADISFKLFRDYGKIVRLSGLIGRPDLLFVYDLDETEKVIELNKLRSLDTRCF